MYVCSLDRACKPRSSSSHESAKPGARLRWLSKLKRQDHAPGGPFFFARVFPFFGKISPARGDILTDYPMFYSRHGAFSRDLLSGKKYNLGDINRFG